MSSQTNKVLVLAFTALFSTLAFAVEPLRAIDYDDVDYGYYSAIVAMDQKMVNEGMINGYTDYNLFKVNGRAVALADGSVSNPYNLVLTVNGNLYYVDAILSSINNFKLRRRWKSNPEPGVFLRIEGTRIHPEDFTVDKVTLWIKIATPEGRALPVLTVLEGDFDL
jgi:hypothetical protein